MFWLNCRSTTSFCLQLEEIMTQQFYVDCCVNETVHSIMKVPVFNYHIEVILSSYYDNLLHSATFTAFSKPYLIGLEFQSRFLVSSSDYMQGHYSTSLYLSIKKFNTNKLTDHCD